MSDLTIPPPPTLEDQIAEVIRELRTRDHVYPRLIDSKRLSTERARDQQRALRAVLATLRQIQADRDEP